MWCLGKYEHIFDYQGPFLSRSRFKQKSLFEFHLISLLRKKIKTLKRTINRFSLYMKTGHNNIYCFYKCCNNTNIHLIKTIIMLMFNNLFNSWTAWNLSRPATDNRSICSTSGYNGLLLRRSRRFKQKSLFELHWMTLLSMRNNWDFKQIPLVIFLSYGFYNDSLIITPISEGRQNTQPMQLISQEATATLMLPVCWSKNKIQ